MPTVDSITRQVELTTNISSKIFRTNLKQSNDSVLIKAPIDSATNLVNSELARKQEINERLEDYTRELENFNARFEARMSSLQASSDKLKDSFQNRDEEDKPSGVLSRLGDFATFKIPPEESDNIREFQKEQRAESRRHNEIISPAENFNRFAERYLVAETQLTNEVNQNLNATRDENISAELSNVRDFVDTFNNAVDYFNANRGLSERMNALAANFGDNQNLVSSLNAVGIAVNEDGRLSVDEEKLADALNENSSDVNAALGQNGLAGRLDRNINLANSQRENLFPNVTEYTGTARIDTTQALYSAQGNLVT